MTTTEIKTIGSLTSGMKCDVRIFHTGFAEDDDPGIRNVFFKNYSKPADAIEAEQVAETVWQELNTPAEFKKERDTEMLSHQNLLGHCYTPSEGDIFVIRTDGEPFCLLCGGRGWRVFKGGVNQMVKFLCRFSRLVEADAPKVETRRFWFDLSQDKIDEDHNRKQNNTH